jgi:hypothetical protein
VTTSSIHAPETFEESLAQMDITAASDANLENYIRQVKEKELDLLVVFPEDFTFADPCADAIGRVVLGIGVAFVLVYMSQKD